MLLFLSYRRADSQEVVGRIYNRLTSHLPVERIFRDLDSIPLGKPFPEVIREALGNSEVALIVIGPRWTAVTDSAGNPRLHDPADPVRIEVELALSSGILVVPVLVSGASMPQAVELPTTLHSLVSLQAIQVHPDPDFHRDMDRLIGKLSHLVDLGPLLPTRGQAEPRASSPSPDCGTATMCRREFLRAGVCAVTVLAIERGLREYDAWLATRAEQVRQEEKVRDLFGQLFGAPAKTRFSHEGTHPDNLAAARVLRPVLRLYDSKPILAPAGGQIKILPEGDVVLIGGPNSTPLTMIAWEFDGPNMRELDRDQDPIIPLRFYGISNVKHPWLPGDPVGWHLETVGPVSTVNWPSSTRRVENREYLTLDRK